MEDELFERMKRANSNLLKIEGHRQVIEDLQSELNRPGIDFDERNDILQEIDRYNSDIEQWQNEINPDLEFINGYNGIIAGIKNHEQLIEDLTNESMEPGVDQFTRNENYSEIERYEEDIRNWKNILSANYKGSGLKEIDFREKSTQEIEEAIKNKIKDINNTIEFYNASIESKQNDLVNNPDDTLETAHEIELMQRELYEIKGELDEYTAIHRSFEIFNKLGITKNQNMKDVVTKNNDDKAKNPDKGTPINPTGPVPPVPPKGPDAPVPPKGPDAPVPPKGPDAPVPPTNPVPPIKPGIEKKEDKEDKKVVIKYSAQTGKYTITDLDDNSKTINAYALQGKKALKIDEKLKFIEKNISREDYERITGGLSKNVLKSFDPNLVTILYEQFGKGKEGIAVVRDYFLTLDGNKKKEDLPYAMTYDLHGIDKVKELKSVKDKDGNDKAVSGKKLSIFDRIRLRNMAIANEPAATVIVAEKTKWWKKAIIGIVSGITALGAGEVIRHQLAEKNNQPNKPENVADTIEPGKNNDDDRNVPVGPSRPSQYQDEDLQFGPTLPFVDLPKNTFIDEIKVDSKLQDGLGKTDKSEELKLGLVLKDLPEGLEYREGMDGGKTGFIGQDENTPVDGFYVIDRSAEIQPDSIKTEYGLNGNDLNKNTNLVHISFVSAAKTYEEALKIIEENKANENYEDIKEKVQPRGWVSAETIKKSLEKKQKQSNTKIKDSDAKEL